MTGPGQLLPCSHPIYAQTPMCIFKVVRRFSLCSFNIFVSIETLESDKLSQSTLHGTKWTLVAQVLKVCKIYIKIV